MTIKLIVLDIDGILSMGEGHPFDLKTLNRLAILNQKSRTGEEVPAVTLNTGRPAPYVEAVTQAISGWQPALYESGAGLFYPLTNHFEETPLLSAEDKDNLTETLAVLDAKLVKTGRAYWQPGKTVCHTLFAQAPLTVDDILMEATEILANYTDKFIAVSAILALNIQPAHIDKATGLEWLSEVTGISKENMAGTGDSGADADFLKLIAYPAAPANATEEVKAVAHYVSSQNATAGLMDMLDFWGV